MKTLALILFLISSVATAQRNTLSACFQPDDLGTGLRYDRLLNQFNDFSLYGSVTHGKFRYGDIAGTGHTKLSAGITHKLYHSNFWSTGVSYHNYQRADIYEGLNWRVLCPVDLEIGAGTVIKRLMVSVCYEIVVNNSVLVIGYKF